MKFYGLEWLRFRAKCEYIATEFGHFFSDVMGMTEHSLYEIEIKTTKADFNNDFKKFKHNSYKKSLGWTPNLFYFFVTENIREYCLDYLVACDSPYGLISFDLDCYGYSYAGMKVFKRARKLHKDKPPDYIRKKILLRMSTEIITVWANYYQALESLNRKPDLFKRWEEMIKKPEDFIEVNHWETSKEASPF